MNEVTVTIHCDPSLVIVFLSTPWITPKLSRKNCVRSINALYNNPHINSLNSYGVMGGHGRIYVSVAG